MVYYLVGCAVAVLWSFNFSMNRGYRPSLGIVLAMALIGPIFLVFVIWTCIRDAEYRRQSLSIHRSVGTVLYFIAALAIAWFSWWVYPYFIQSQLGRL